MKDLDDVPGLRERFGWPQCAVCHKPVDEVLVFKQVASLKEIIMVKCHGQHQEVEFDPWELVTNEKIDIRLDGPAFANEGLWLKSNHG